MEVGIIGFEKSGKTSLFNALTGQKAAIGGFTAQGAEPNVAVVKVPDARLDRLTELFKAPKVVHATIKYIDVAGIPAREGKSGDALSDALLKAVANADALLAVIRAFDSGGIAANPESDLETIQAELILSDLLRVETRLERIEKSIGKLTGDPRKALEKEQSALKKCKTILESEKPVRAAEFDAEEAKALRAFQLMTLKPLILVINLSEDEIDKSAAWEEKVRAKGLPVGTAVVACCAKSEMEIAAMESEAERKEFLESFGISAPAAHRVIQVSYETLGLMSFFTAGPTEAHAWTIRRGQNAVDAAGTIHSDLARGFIRAEIIGCEDLLRCGGLAQAKKEGVLRLEGKTYIVQDGDVIEIRFSV